MRSGSTNTNRCDRRHARTSIETYAVQSTHRRITLPSSSTPTSPRRGLWFTLLFAGAKRLKRRVAFVALSGRAPRVVELVPHSLALFVTFFTKALLHVPPTLGLARQIVGALHSLAKTDGSRRFLGGSILNGTRRVQRDRGLVVHQREFFAGGWSVSPMMELDLALLIAHRGWARFDSRRFAGWTLSHAFRVLLAIQDHKQDFSCMRFWWVSARFLNRWLTPLHQQTPMLDVLGVRDFDVASVA